MSPYTAVEKSPGLGIGVSWKYSKRLLAAFKSNLGVCE